MSKIKPILETNLNPFFLFKEWYEEAEKNEVNDPNAMNLSSISSDFRPTSRIVLLKSFKNEEFIFYTNMQSKKGKTILSNKNVALTFHWKSLLKQIRIEGQASKVLDDEADEYFNSRPYESRIGAWASKQSQDLSSRKILEENFEYYKNKFKNKKISRPPHWSGFRVKPDLIEFWQDMPFRLHDRVEFRKVKNRWVGKKLFP